MSTAYRENRGDPIVSAEKVADAAKLLVIRALLERIEAYDQALPTEALEVCRARIRDEGWRYDRSRTAGKRSDLGRDVAQLFIETKADLMIEVLRDFIAAHRIGQPGRRNGRR
jgi:hypothetical protein